MIFQRKYKSHKNYTIKIIYLILLLILIYSIVIFLNYIWFYRFYTTTDIWSLIWEIILLPVFIFVFFCALSTTTRFVVHKILENYDYSIVQRALEIQNRDNSDMLNYIHKRAYRSIKISRISVLVDKILPPVEGSYGKSVYRRSMFTYLFVSILLSILILVHRYYWDNVIEIMSNISTTIYNMRSPHIYIPIFLFFAAFFFSSTSLFRGRGEFYKNSYSKSYESIQRVKFIIERILENLPDLCDEYIKYMKRYLDLKYMYIESEKYNIAGPDGRPYIHLEIYSNKREVIRIKKEFEIQISHYKKSLIDMSNIFKKDIYYSGLDLFFEKILYKNKIDTFTTSWIMRTMRIPEKDVSFAPGIVQLYPSFFTEEVDRVFKDSKLPTRNPETLNIQVTDIKIRYMKEVLLLLKLHIEFFNMLKIINTYINSRFKEWRDSIASK